MTNYRLASLALLACICAACGAHTSGTASSLPSLSSLRPDVAQKGKGAQYVRFALKGAGGQGAAIVAGPDGNMWFLDEGAGALARVSMAGIVKEFSLSGSLGGSPVSLALGADKKFYISDETTSIAVATTAGKSKSIAIPSGDNTSLDGIGAGPDGNVWFAEVNHIGKVTPAGVITEYAYPTQPGTNQYGGVTAGSDGNVWFAESSQNAIGRIVPSTGTISMFQIPVSCTPAAVVLAKDNNVWFACLASAPQMGRITPAGVISVYPIGGSFEGNETEQFCARGPDGEPWCASRTDDNIFRVNTASQTVTIFTPPLPELVNVDALSAGPDGNVWIDTLGGNALDVLVTNPMTVSPLKLSFTAAGQTGTLTVSESTVSAWTAKSSNTAVATVAQGGSASTFTVTATGSGNCTIKISDNVSNSVSIKVSVL